MLAREAPTAGRHDVERAIADLEEWLPRPLAARGILVRAASLRGLAEEAGFAYKSVDEVAEATEEAGLSRRVAHLVSIGNVKG